MIKKTKPLQEGQTKGNVKPVKGPKLAPPPPPPNRTPKKNN